MSRRFATAVTAVVTTVILTSVAAGGAAAPGKQLPVDVTPPTISGTATVGSGMTAAPGTWSGKGLRYSNQWLRCDSTGASCGAITGASNWTYGLSAAASGATFRVIVTATNRNGSTAATSAATAVVSSATSSAGGLPSPSPATSPSNTSPPTVSGTAQQGLTVTGAAGTWSGTSPIAYGYQWQRCDSAGASCAPIAGATNRTYLLASADIGSTVRLSVTGSNSAGSATASSSATTVVTAPSSPTTSPSGSVTFSADWNDGTTIPSGWGAGCNGTFTADTGIFATPSASGRFDVAGSQNRCELYHNNNPIGNHVDAYYAFAVRIPSDWNDNTNITQFGMESINGAPAGVDLTANKGVILGVQSGNCGTIGSGTGCPYASIGTVQGWAPRPSGFLSKNYILQPGQLTPGVWHQFIVHIYWTTSNDGHYEAWHKVLGSSTWTKTFEYNYTDYPGGFPTLQWGQQAAECGGGTITPTNVGTWTTCTGEIFGIYAGGYQWVNPNGTVYWFPPVTVWMDDYCRASTFDAAITCLG